MAGSYQQPGIGGGDSSRSSFSSSDLEAPSISSRPLFGGGSKKSGDLRSMLDSNKDVLKLEAMKILIGMIAKGTDCSDYFPAVVKNVVAKNSEVKKLVYVYLVRYAEEQQDTALLSISTFQKALKDPNQLIRASALRVLSSIRVPIIAPIMMLSIKESSTDLSPYVRKAAAHAIPKLYTLDPDQKDALIEVIEKLLKDQTTLVAGSVVMAFEMVCPDRIDLVHKNYRKLCTLLVDVDEWGQVVILNMLTRYARTQFINPNKEEFKEEAFYPESESEESSTEDSENEDKKKKKKPVYSMDSDHRLLLKNAKPLLQSRNSAVVMATAQLYHYIAPKEETTIIAKPLIRLLRSHREVQSTVLSNIATITAQRSMLFEPYMKNFFVHSNDPTHIRLLKLEIISNIAGESNIHSILREFRTYVNNSDKEFVTTTIQSIGRVACSIPEVTEVCLHGLTTLLSNKDETVVGEAVVVIKKLIQLQPKEHKDLIVHVAKLVDTVTVPMARASILWLIGEYCHLIPKIAPDVLRKAAKSFTSEEDIVKLQIVNLAAKLCVTNKKQTHLLYQYVLNLAKYDQNYDIRDRARFLRQLVVPDEETALSKHAKKILLASKPASVLESSYTARSVWRIGSLSHIVNNEATGYIPLPDFPEEPPDPTVRNVEDDLFYSKIQKKKKKSFYSSEESSSEEESSSSFYSSVGSSEESGSETGSGSEGSTEEETSEETSSGEESSSSTDAGEVLANLKQKFSKKQQQKKSESETSSTEESTSEESDESDGPIQSQSRKQKAAPAAVTTGAKPGKPQESTLLSLDNWDLGKPASQLSPTPLIGDVLKPNTTESHIANHSSSSPVYKIVPPAYKPSNSTDLLNRITGQGLTAEYKFTRRAHVYSPKMVAIEITFTNKSDGTLSGISIGSKRLQSGMAIKDIPQLTQLAPGGSISVTMGIDFNDTLQPAKFDLCVFPDKKFPVQIQPLVGELIQAIEITHEEFLKHQAKLSGMNETSDKVGCHSSAGDVEHIKSTVLQRANLCFIDSSNTTNLHFAALTLSSQVLVLLTIKLMDGGVKITVNCEKMVIGSMLVKDIKEALGK